MLQTLNFKGSRRVDTAATFFRYESGSASGADESIRVRADGSDLGLYWPGDAVELPKQCSAWDIEPVTATCAGTIRLGLGRVESARLVGSVRVIDSNAEKTAAARQFIHSISQPAQAGQVSIIGIAASTKKLSIKRIQISSATAGAIYLIGGSGLGTATVVNTSMINKLMGGALSGAKLTLGYAAGTLPVAAEMPGAFYWLIASVPANTPTEIALTTPIVISGSQLLALSSGVVNRDISLLVDAEEID